MLEKTKEEITNLIMEIPQQIIEVCDEYKEDEDMKKFFDSIEKLMTKRNQLSSLYANAAVITLPKEEEGGLLGF